MPASFMEVARSESAMVLDGLSDATLGLRVWSTGPMLELAPAQIQRRPATSSKQWHRSHVHCNSHEACSQSGSKFSC